MTGIESLHTHTTLSDGKLSRREMFDFAESLGVSVLAFTDHDSVPTPKILDELETLRGHNTKWIIGTELTTDLPHELAKKYKVIVAGGSDAHRKEDLEFYVANDWFSGEATGFTERILATGRVNKKFSSL